MKTGDEVVTIPNLWHEGIDIGDRLAVILDTTSYILISIYEYNNNPVKCFRNEVEELNRFDPEDDEIQEYIDRYIP